MYHYHETAIKRGVFSLSEYLASVKNYGREHERAIDCAETMLASKSPEEAFLIMSQTWRAIGDALGKAPADGVLIAWFPAILACLDAIPAIRGALKARHEAPDPAFEALRGEEKSIVQRGERFL